MNRNSKTPIRVGLFMDNWLFAAGLVSVINQMDNCTVVFTSTEAEDMAVKLNRTPALCMLDVNIHSFYGKSLIQKLKKENEAVKIIILSPVDHPYNITRTFNTGADGHLPKTADAKAVHRAIVSVFYTGNYYNESVFRQSKLNMNEHDIITDLELNMLDLFCSERSVRDIAMISGYSPAIIEGYKQILFNKLNVHSRERMVITAYEIGLVSKSRCSGVSPEHNLNKNLKLA